MKVVILAGGYGTRISEESIFRPKPMIEVAGMPILWHIMKIYSYYGLNDFIICSGYKSYVIKEFFANYFLHRSDVTFDFAKSDVSIHNSECEPWKVTVIDTGEKTMTGGRIKRIKEYVGTQDFCLTYGDGVADVDIRALIKHHQEHKKLATITTVIPPGRFGAVKLDGDSVQSFQEKPPGDGTYINGGFFVLKPKIFDYIVGDETIWEKEPLMNLADQGQLAAYKYDGFWMAMDTIRDKTELEKVLLEKKFVWNK